MELKYFSWGAVVVCVMLNIFSFFGCLLLGLGCVSIVLGILCTLYLQHGDLDEFLSNNIVDNNPLTVHKSLGLNLACDQKPILLILPNVKEQTESKGKHNKAAVHDHRKKSLIDTGIEMLFKKSSKNNKDHHNHSTDFKIRPEVVLDSNHRQRHHGSSATSSPHHSNHLHPDDKRWKPFETIKIYTDRRKSHDGGTPGDRRSVISVGEECDLQAIPLHVGQNPEVGLLDEHGSPNKKKKCMLSGQQNIDNFLHTIIDYVLRDYIDSWFNTLTENKEFSEFRTRNCAEESIQNICNRIKNTQWIPLITTKLIEDVATHSRLYRLAQQATSCDTKSSDAKQRNSPQRRHHYNKKDHQQPLQHRRNKSDTDLSWYLGTASVQKNVANSKFYTEPIDEKTLCDPEAKLLKAFFDISELYRNECLDEAELEKYLTHAMETILYFTLPEEDFACLPLRTFLSTLLANVVCKPILDLLSDPDFINLQVARLLPKDAPAGEYFIKLIRQCNDLSELRACRQFITKEMDLKFKDGNSSSELNSLKYTQKLIDLRLSYLQSNKSEITKLDRGDKPMSNLPILTLDELLTKELALSYYLDYLSILNLQKYVIFYLTAVEWKLSATGCMLDIQTNKNKSSREEILNNLREKAGNIYKEYLVPASTNCLQIDRGLVEALNIKISNSVILPENTWFDSICKFVYEKLKNEDVFLNQFYQSSAYKKLLLELEVCGNTSETLDLDANLASLNLNFDTGSDSNSGDIPYEDDAEEELEVGRILTKLNGSGGSGSDDSSKFLGVGGHFKHSRSHSDCTGLVQNVSDIIVGPFQAMGNGAGGLTLPLSPQPNKTKEAPVHFLRPHSPQPPSVQTPTTPTVAIESFEQHQKLLAKIINTAIHCEGQYAVYAMQVSVVEDNQQKSWHIYRRYSKFLELKKVLVKRYPNISHIPFPAKKTFQNTERSVLEHRMVVLNEFLRMVCLRAEINAEIHKICRDFMEPDTNDKKLHGGTVIRTIETLVNPIKSGMRTIKNMPDTLVGGIAKILLGKGPMKEASFFDVMPVIEHSWEYPALTSALNLLDEVFDLQARSQWLRRGIINRLLGAPWVSHAANKKIVHAAKTFIEVDKIESVLNAVLNNVWPDGKLQRKSVPREDNTKLRTRMAAKIALLYLLSDELKHVVGSETTRSGLLNFFTMWQNKTLNLRLALVIFNHILTTLYQTESMTKHVKD